MQHNIEMYARACVCVSANNREEELQKQTHCQDTKVTERSNNELKMDSFFSRSISLGLSPSSQLEPDCPVQTKKEVIAFTFPMLYSFRS